MSIHYQCKHYICMYQFYIHLPGHFRVGDRENLSTLASFIQIPNVNKAKLLENVMKQTNRKKRE